MQPHASTVCPSCATPLDPLPKAKKKRPACGNAVYVRSGPDGRRHFLAESQLASHEEWWARHSAGAMQESAARQGHEYDAASRGEDAARGYLVGDYAPDVVGTQHYQEALASLEAEASPSGELITELLREPDNRYDPNAVRVIVGGQTVGYLERSDASAYQPLLRQLERGRRRALCRALLTREGKYGQFGIEIEGIPEPPDSD